MNKTDEDITLQKLIEEYREIRELIAVQWPIADRQQRIFARTLKMMEELGELSDEILSSMNLQRASKISKYNSSHLKQEYADVFSCVLLLGIELDIDIEAVILDKIGFTRNRLVREMTTAHPRLPDQDEADDQSSKN